MRGECKAERMREYLKRAIDLYLAENTDIIGYIYVEDIILSDDQRKCRVLLKADGNFENNYIIKKLSEKKIYITKRIEQYCKLRYYPALRFIIDKDDKMDF